MDAGAAMAAAAGRDRLRKVYHECALCMMIGADTAAGPLQAITVIISPVGTAGLHLRHRCQSSTACSRCCGPGSCPHQAFGS